MKTSHTNIGIYDWDVYYLKIENFNEVEKVKKYVNKTLSFLEEEYRDQLIEESSDKSFLNAGWHFYNNNQRRSVIVIFPCSSRERVVEIFAHEKRHCEDNICSHLGLKGKEAPAYLAGFLAKELWTEIK